MKRRWYSLVALKKKLKDLLVNLEEKRRRNASIDKRNDQLLEPGDEVQQESKIAQEEDSQNVDQ